MVEFDSLKVKDQLGRPEDKNITVKRFTENLIVEDNALVIQTKTIGKSFVLGSATNGVLGTSVLGVGSMIWGHSSNGIWGESRWGENSRVTTTMFVVNPNNTFRERFRDDYFKDSSTTADWAVVEGELSFTTGEIAVSDSVAYNDITVSSATITVTVDTGSVSDLSFQLSADGGSNWESVTHNTSHTFSNSGTDLRFKITATGTVKLSYVKVTYS